MKITLKRIIIFLTLALLLLGCSTAADEAPLDIMTVYFLDVGQADAALITVEGQTMLIDGGNASDSDFIFTFLRNNNITHLDYIIATHPHEDHVGGLAGALNFATVGTAFSPVTEHDTRAFRSFVRYLDEQGVSITVPRHGYTFQLGSAEIQIIAPIDVLTSNINDLSIVLRITHGKVSFLFTGDAERDSEQEMLEFGYDLSATVLKVGHHGSNTSTTYPFLREIMPVYAVISAGRDNPHGHPHEEVLSRLRDADATLFRTDMQGMITAVSDGETVSFTVERNANIQTNPTIQAGTSETSNNQSSNYAGEYIGNRNSKRLHYPTCTGLPLEHNRVFFTSKDEAFNEGFEPCGICMRD